ncbi:MAG: MerR family transcriptional regulator [Bacteroidia bacterium]
MEEDEQVEKLYYSMGDVTAMFNVAPSLLRFWEKEFDVLDPKKNKKGNRLYTKADIETIKLIHYLTKEQGHTLQGAKEKLKTRRQPAEKNMAALESLKKVRQFLVEMREEL